MPNSLPSHHGCPPTTAVLETLWGRIHRMCDRGLKCSLRPGLPLASLSDKATLAVWRALPADLAASLLIHDGQHEAWGLGLFFGGSRLLSLAELARTGATHTAPPPPALAPGTASAAEAPRIPSGTAGGASGAPTDAAAWDMDGAGGRLKLTDMAGFQGLACGRDGAVYLCSGFNEHRKSDSWASFLERLLRATV